MYCSTKSRIELSKWVVQSTKASRVTASQSGYLIEDSRSELIFA